MNGLRIGTVADIPVFISPWYLVLIAYAGMSGGDPVTGALWVLCISVSLLVHEFGHAMVARHFRLHPQILLHGFGGLCGHDRAERDLHDVLIISAGPAAGLLLGLVAFGVQFVLAMSTNFAAQSPIVTLGLGYLIWLNVFWSLINLLPIWPLDGGQLFRLFMLRVTSPIRAERITHWTAIALCMGAIGLTSRFFLGAFGLLLAGLIAWENWRALRGDRASGPIRAQSKFSRELLKSARTAFAAEDWQEAARVCHQIRAEPRIPESVLLEVWRLLGLSTARIGRQKEAISYLKRAKLTEDVAETYLRCLLQTERHADVDELLESRDWQRMGLKGPQIVDRIRAEFERTESG